MSEIPIDKQRCDNNSVLAQMDDGLKKRFSIFIKKLRVIKQEQYFKKQLLGGINKINTGLNYKDVDLVLEGVNDLMIDLKFTSVRLVNNRGIQQANKIRVSRLVAGRLLSVQMRPFKNGAALVLVKKIKKEKNRNKVVVSVDVKPAVEESDEYIMLNNQLWRGSEDGLHKKNVVKKESVFNGVATKRGDNL